MPFFSKVFKQKDAAGPAGKGRLANDAATAGDAGPAKPKFEDAWARHWVSAGEVDELLHVCTQEMKSRALDMPFLLLPFRPSSDPSAARTFIRNYFKTSYGPSEHLNGESLQHELKLIEPLVLCSIMKWCWSRLNGGVVTWTTYELFKKGEIQSKMAKHAFDTFIPLSAKDDAHRNIIFDFFDLLAAIAANGKTNGLGGRKLSRLAGWWAFELSDDGKGFDGGYKSWEAAANASSHLFFAYLRSLAPDGAAGSSGISKLPRSLQALVSQTEYPPEAPTLLQTITPKVVMLVDTVSPTPYSLLRRAKHFEYRDDDRVLQAFSNYDDPVQALTFECRRVLDAIASTNQSAMVSTEAQVASPTDASWSRFEDLGFSSLLDENGRLSESGNAAAPRFSSVEMRSAPGTGYNDIGRPKTPSWADFLSAGFADDSTNRGPASLLLPPDQMLPPIGQSRLNSSASNMSGAMLDENLEPGELASISKVELDETFWWVWMTSLAGEEPSQRKAVFGRCAFIETEISGGRWVVMEERLKGTNPTADENAYMLEKRNTKSSLFSRRSRARRQSLGRKPPSKKAEPYLNQNAPKSMVNVDTQQQAKVEAAAAALLQKEQDGELQKIQSRHRARTDERSESKTNSVLTLQPVIMKEAGPAMQWARKFDKETIRAKYLGDDLAGKGITRSESPVGTVTSEPKVDSSAAAAGLGAADMDKALPAQPMQHSASSRSLRNDNLPDPSKPPPLPPPPKELDTSMGDSADQSRSPVAPTTPVKGHRKEESEQTVVDKDVVSPSALNHTHRKPVSVDKTDKDHPAYRNPQSAKNTPTKKKEDQTLPPARPVNPAAAAAAAASRAMANPSAAQTAASTEVKSKKGSTRVMNKFFGRKNKQEEEPEAIARHRQIVKGSPGQDKTLNRRTSVLRKKKTSSRPETPSAANAAPKPAPQPAPSQPVAEPQMADLENGEPGPDQVTEYEDAAPMSQAPPMAEPSHPNESVSQFSNFTQGPLEDQPAYAPESNADASHRSVSPVSQSEMSSKSFNTRAAAKLYQQDPDVPAPTVAAPEARYTGAVEETEHGMADDETSEAGAEPTQPASGTLQSAVGPERWAQMRKNDADRRISDDHVSRPSQSVRTERTDDGETSGEETIEQRVARIKARVAELTAGTSASRINSS